MTSHRGSLELHHIKPAGMDMPRTMIDISMNLKGGVSQEQLPVGCPPMFGIGFGMLGGERVGWFTLSSSNYSSSRNS